jgi:Tat protein translocase TatB subunit
MFGLGMPEILMILAIALIVIGPKKLPDLAKTLGRAMGEFKRSAQDFKRSIDVETTVNDIKEDLDISATDLNKIITDPPVEDEPATEDSEGAAEEVSEDTPEEDSNEAASENSEGSGFQDNEKKIPDNDEEGPIKDEGSSAGDNTSEPDKIDTP